MRPVLWCVLALVVGRWTASAAQRLPERPLTIRPLAVDQTSAPSRQPDDFGGPMLGAAIGSMGGLLLVSSLSRCNRESCAWEGLENGVYIGWPLGAALGAHVGNARRGSLFWDLFGTALASAVGRELARRSEDRGWMVLYSMLSRIVVAAAVERSTGAGRAPRDTLTLRPDSAR